MASVVGHDSNESPAFLLFAKRFIWDPWRRPWLTNESAEKRHYKVIGGFYWGECVFVVWVFIARKIKVIIDEEIWALILRFERLNGPESQFNCMSFWELIRSMYILRPSNAERPVKPKWYQESRGTPSQFCWPFTPKRFLKSCTALYWIHFPFNCRFWRMHIRTCVCKGNNAKNYLPRNVWPRIVGASSLGAELEVYRDNSDNYNHEDR